MGATYKSTRVMRPRQSVLIATPAYELVKPGYAHSLAMTTAELTRKGVPFDVFLMSGNCHVDDGRNSLVADMLNETQYTDLVFIDADVRWDPAQFMRLISWDTEDIIAGAYPLKSYPLRFPVGKILEVIDKDRFAVSYMPTGFMRIPRTVFEKLIPSQTKRGGKFPTYRFFERRYTETTYDGGDVTFCRKWIAEGGKVICDAGLTLEHHGDWRWTGRFVDYLGKDENRELHTLKAKDPVPLYKPDHPQERPAKKSSTLVDAMWALDELKEGRDDTNVFETLSAAWGNSPWAATPEYLRIAWKMASNLEEGASILECGSGVSTIVLALAAAQRGLRLVSVEHDDRWIAELNGWVETMAARYGMAIDMPECRYDETKRWYDYEPSFSPSMILVDGPPRNLGADRLYPLRQPWASEASVLIDDASDEVISQLREITGQWVPMDLGRPACAGRIQAVLSAA